MTSHTLKHASISSVGDGKDVRWNLMTLLAFVQLYDFLSVDRVEFVRVYNNTEKSRICL